MDKGCWLGGGGQSVAVRASGRMAHKKPVKPTEYVWGFTKPEDDNLTLREKIQYAIYDKRDGTIFGRTPINWCKLLIFYIIFYIVLAILFAICMKGLLMSIDPQHPTYILDSSIIGTNPGMGFRPMPKLAEEGTSVVWFQASNKTNIKIWVDTVNEFLEPYLNKPGHSNRVICDYDKPLPAPGKVCTVDVSGDHWGPCRQNNNYGFPSSSPCIFLKLNRIYGWKPEFYTDVDNLPKEMPTTLVNEIKTAAKRGKEHLNTIWVSCNPEGPADNETIGPIQYWPRAGFAGYYYPYENQEGYLSPLVAVQFKRPPIAKLVNVECRAWAKNIVYQKQTGAKDRMGSVHFEVLVDP